MTTISTRLFPFPVAVLFSYLVLVTVFGKGPTYLGFSFRATELYFGEIVLALLLGWLFLRWAMGQSFGVFRDPLAILVFAFLVYGALRTIPGFLAWRAEALRDAAVWYYAAFFFVGSALATMSSSDDFWRRLRPIWVLALIWTTVNIPLNWALAESSPVLSARGVPVLSGSGSENVEHAALGIVLVALGLVLTKVPPFLKLLLTAGGSAACLAYPGRGVKVAIATAILAAVVVNRGRVPSVWVVGSKRAVGWLLVLGLAAILVTGGARAIVQTTHLSRFDEVTGGEVEGTARWRSEWWGNIWDEVNARNPLLGLGFGYDLQDLNPFLKRSNDAFPVRSPHNFTFTVFGRMGVVGLFLWLSIIVVALKRLVGLQRLLSGDPEWLASRREFVFWFIFVLATLLNASFGVLMEGPVLGIWFWLAVGFSVRRGAILVPTLSERRTVVAIRRLATTF